MGNLAKLAGALGFICLAGPAAAAVDVDLELVLAVDVSRSMDRDEQALQRNGYIAAFRHSEVIEAIRSGLTGRIAVAYMEWSGPAFQQVLVPWTVIGSTEEAAAFASSLEQVPIMREMGTSISGGLGAAARLFEASDARSIRRVIDISGDGPNNMGLPVEPMRDSVIEQGIAINGLPIVLKTSSAYSLFNIPDLDVYYEDCVIGGPGAFMITVDDMNGFAKAVRRKLVLEISGLTPRLMQAAAVRQAPRVDCMIGEKIRERWMNPSTK